MPTNALDLILSILKICAAASIGFYVLIVLIVYFVQNKLLFFPQKTNAFTVKSINSKFPKSSTKLQTKDGVILQGWFIEEKQEKPAPLLIYFGGNAENIDNAALDKQYLEGISLLTFNFRGYGKSGGKPSEATMLQDALLIYDKYSRKDNVDPNQIYVMGRSLGTGAAVYLAAHRKVAKVILVSPYDSLENVAKAQYPYLPISLLIKNPLRSVQWAPKIHAPLLCLLAKNDVVIPNHFSEALLNQWDGIHHKVLFPHHDHNTIMSAKRYWPEIIQFLKKSR